MSSRATAKVTDGVERERRCLYVFDIPSSYSSMIKPNQTPGPYLRFLLPIFTHNFLKNAIFASQNNNNIGHKSPDCASLRDLSGHLVRLVVCMQSQGNLSYSICPISRRICLPASYTCWGRAILTRRSYARVIIADQGGSRK